MDLKRTLTAFTAAVLTGCSAAPAPAADNVVVRTTAGTVEGVDSGAVNRFLGLAYAAPPVGDLRWRAPQPAPSWTGTRRADRHGAACAQGPQRTDANEDCLYLDVTVPDGGARYKPVMVWLHGGGLAEGAGRDYDPTRLATRGDVVVVTVEFRLGIFGFFGHPDLADSGTFGLLDQQAALRWVRDNIAAFGGDPRNVTLFGESGGAIGACAQLIAPSSAGLFHRVILQSGTCGTEVAKDSSPTGNPAYRFMRPLTDLVQAGSDAVAALQCRRDSAAQTLGCLRALPPDAFHQTPQFGQAAYGTPLLPRDPAEALQSGDYRHVPALVGHNRDEHRLTAGLFALAGWRLSTQDYPRLITKAFEADAPAVLNRYPLERHGNDGALAWAAVFTDYQWACDQIDTGAALSRDAPTYTYQFADDKAQPIVDLPADFPAGASHASELQHLFDVAGRQPLSAPRYTDAQRRLADTMVDYWTAFARTGNPNGDPTPHWPVADPQRPGRTALQLAPDAITPIDATTYHQCDFWHTIRPT